MVGFAGMIRSIHVVLMFSVPPRIPLVSVLTASTFAEVGHLSLTRSRSESAEPCPIVLLGFLFFRGPSPEASEGGIWTAAPCSPLSGSHAAGLVCC